MNVIPLGIGSSFCAAPYQYSCALVNNRLLIDAAPSCAVALRVLGITADDLSAVVITHFHPDHIFGFPFILAQRSADADPLHVVGPAGTQDRLEKLCALSFSAADPGKMFVSELPAGKQGEIDFDNFHLKSLPMKHAAESLGFLITGEDGSRLAYSGDTARCQGLEMLLAEPDMAIVEMTFIAGGTPDHLCLENDLAGIVAISPENCPLFLTHLSDSREKYIAAIRGLAAKTNIVDRERMLKVVPAEELHEYVI